MPPTPLDFEFDVFRIPVRVSGFFWILPVIFGVRNGHPLFIVIWALVIFTAILVHELGHALIMRRFGISPRIALTMMGGYATTNDRDVWNVGSYQKRSGNQQIIISAAGPLAGFALAAVVVGLVIVFGGWVNFGLVYGFFPLFDLQLVRGEPFFPEFQRGMASMPTNLDLIHELVTASLFVNIYWGIMNLLPVYPLDGGNIAREVMIKTDPIAGLRNSLWLSVIAGGIVGAFGLFQLGQPFLGIMFAVFAFQSWQMIQRMDGKGFGGRGW